jgi:hypothetical protein
MQSYGYCKLHIYPIRSIYLQSFMLIYFIVLELCPGQSSKSKNEQRAITPKLENAELLFLCTEHLTYEIYLPKKFHVDISNNFRVMSQLCVSAGSYILLTGKTIQRSPPCYHSYALHSNSIRSVYLLSWYLKKFLCYPLDKKMWDSRMDKAATSCSPFGEHKNLCS